MHNSSLSPPAGAKTMSEPPTTTPAPISPPERPNQHVHRHPPHFSTAPPLAPTTSSATSSPLVREYRKGNWTIHETLILINAKKLDEDRRIKASSAPMDPTTTKGELRWKRVENYCWNHGCLRSSNQCNDKWDNLLRDYKKVRQYESKVQSNGDLPSYWNMEKQDRKLRNLPSNMATDVFQALNEVLQRKYATQRSSLRDPQTISVSPTPAPLSVRPLLPAPASSSPPVASGTNTIQSLLSSDKFIVSENTIVVKLPELKTLPHLMHTL